MPFSSNNDLPEAITSVLPAEAQTVFRTVVNKEIEQGASEDSAFAQAWTAVKSGWEKTPEGKWVKKDVKKNEFSITTEVCKVDDELGLVFGFGMVCKIAGEDHFDLQNHHIPEDTMLRVLTKFMTSGNAEVKEMHTGDKVGNVVFAFPMTTEIAKSFNIQIEQTGALIAVRPDNDSTVQKFKNGELKGFSIGGLLPVFEDVE